MIYLDNLATTPVDPRVMEAARPSFETLFGNPHSAEHEMGHAAARAVEAARAEVASLIGADPREIIFTSGATEANNLAIKGAARFAGSAGRRQIVTLATEHKCVLESVRDLASEGFVPVIMPVLPDGLVDLPALKAALEKPTLLVSVMAANNETGVLQNLPAVAELVKAAGALLHSDLAQAAGKIPVDVNAMGLHLASISGHKLYGPKGWWRPGAWAAFGHHTGAASRGIWGGVPGLAGRDAVRSRAHLVAAASLLEPAAGRVPWRRGECRGGFESAWGAQPTFPCGSGFGSHCRLPCPLRIDRFGLHVRGNCAEPCADGHGSDTGGGGA